jgi:hypothetical protein
MNFHNMAEQLKMFMIVNDIFLGKLSIRAQCLRLLWTMIGATEQFSEQGNASTKNSHPNSSSQLTHITKFGLNSAKLQQPAVKSTT